MVRPAISSRTVVTRPPCATLRNPLIPGPSATRDRREVTAAESVALAGAGAGDDEEGGGARAHAPWTYVLVAAAASGRKSQEPGLLSGYSGCW